MPQPQSPPATSTAGAGAAGAGAKVTAGSAAALALGGSAAGAAAMTGAGAIVAALITFLVSLREMHRRWLLTHLGRFSGVSGDIAEVVAEEMRREDAFAQASADRLSSALPQAMAIADPAERAAAVRGLLGSEERYAQQRAEAMAARAIAAVTRASLRRESPLGAFWRLGLARDHTPGCIVMAGGDREGSGKFWPWAVLDRVHPPRHYGCTSTLHGLGESIANGWMSMGDVPDTRDALRAAGGVVMEQETADALLAEVELREQLVEAGVDADALALQPWEGLAEAFNPSEPRGKGGRWIRLAAGEYEHTGHGWRISRINYGHGDEWTAVHPDQNALDPLPTLARAQRAADAAHAEEITTRKKEG